MFPIDIYLAIYLILIGFIVGILSGFFGFGGGFIVTPFLFTIGLPMNIAVGTSIAKIMGTSMIATMRHRSLRHVDMKLGMIISVGSIIGVEFGVQMVEYFKGISAEALDKSVSLTYVFVLGFVSILMSYDAWKSRRSDIPPSKSVIADKIQCFKVPPMVTLLQPKGASVSFWVILLVGLITGMLAGFMGAGGGFIQVPMLIYVIRCGTTVAVGTGLFGILISGVYACFSHAIKGNVNIILAAIMLAGSSVGAPIGASATKYVNGANLRLAFGFCVGLISLSVIFNLMAKLLEIYVFGLLSQALLVLTAVSVALLIVILTFLPKRI